MNFRFTEEQEALRAAFKDFVKQEVEPNAVRWDEEDYCPKELNHFFRPNTYLCFADVRFSEQKHAQPRLSDAAAERLQQFAF